MSKVTRYSPCKWKDCDGDWFTTGVEERDTGDYVTYKDYASLDSNHSTLAKKLEESEAHRVALVAAVKKERELEGELVFVMENDATTLFGEIVENYKAARAEVRRLLEGLC